MFTLEHQMIVRCAHQDLKRNRLHCMRTGNIIGHKIVAFLPGQMTLDHDSSLYI